MKLKGHLQSKEFVGERIEASSSSSLNRKLCAGALRFKRIMKEIEMKQKSQQLLENESITKKAVAIANTPNKKHTD